MFEYSQAFLVLIGLANLVVTLLLYADKLIRPTNGQHYHNAPFQPHDDDFIDDNQSDTVLAVENAIDDNESDTDLAVKNAVKNAIETVKRTSISRIDINRDVLPNKTVFMIFGDSCALQLKLDDYYGFRWLNPHINSSLVVKIEKSGRIVYIFDMHLFDVMQVSPSVLSFLRSYFYLSSQDNIFLFFENYSRSKRNWSQDDTARYRQELNLLLLNFGYYAFPNDRQFVADDQPQIENNLSVNGVLPLN